MPTPREQGGRLSEASRLLQEGLELLDQRTREVDALVQRAEERARQVEADAEQRAQEITAEAERQRSELAEQVAALRAEVAAAREELAALRSAPPAAQAEAADPAAAGPESGATAALGAEEAAYVRAAEPGAGTTAADAAEIAAVTESTGAPRWGRPSSIAAAQQAIRTRSARPRWIPPWFPFVLVMLVAAAVVATTVDGQVGPRGSPGEPTAAAEPRLSVLPTAANPTSTATTLTTILVVAAVTAAAPTQASTTMPTAARTASPTPRPTLTLPLARASITVPAALPAPVSPEGPIVAAYTTYSTYTVQPGDTLNRVATQFGVNGDVIIRTSNIADPNLLVPGQVLSIPRDSGWLYRVQPSDTLDLVAVRFGVSVDDLLQASGLTSPAIRPGDLLFIPNKALPLSKQ